MSELPAWVKPKALIFYRPEQLLFFYESYIKRSNQPLSARCSARLYRSRVSDGKL
jgi:hypothetical protein